MGAVAHRVRGKSPHFADQTEMYSDKRWVDMRFCRNEIEADPRLEVKRLR